MPKRGSNADRRVFFDELLSLTASRLKASGAIRFEDRHGVIAFGDEDDGVERRKCIGVAHNSRTAARGAILSVPGAVAGKKSSGSSTMRHAA
jgi:hypothetical protein